MRTSIRILSFALASLALALPLSWAADVSSPLPDFEERRQLLIGDKPDRLVPSSWTAAPTAQDTFDVTHYLIDIDFDDSQETVQGSVTITADSLLDGLQHLQLDLLDNMTVSAVSRGLTNLAFTHDTDLLDITLDQPFDVGESFQVRVSYSGSPASGGFGTFGWNKYSGSGQGEMVWSLSEPEGARNWWPCKDRPDDKALVEEWWTVRSDWTATGNGVLAGADSLPGNRTRYRWVSTHPLTTYLVSIAASDYATFSHSYTSLEGESMPIDYFVYPGDLSDAQTSFSETAAMLEFYAQTFGEYPFVEDKYGMSSFPFGGAMEHSTNTSYGYFLINGGHQYDFVIAHEAAHQWWGDSVSPETWPDIWLNEGFATYSEALWFEHLGGQSALYDYMDGLYSSSFNGPLYDPNGLFTSTTYDKGGWVLHMLRGVMGDADFFQGLRNWHSSHEHSTGNTAQFQATMEALYGSSLDFFFQPWVYGSNRPRYEYGHLTADTGSGTYRTYVTIRQTQTNAGLFTMPIDMTLITAAGGEARSVWNDGAEQGFVLETTSPVTDFLFDPNDWILKGTTTEVSLQDGDGDGVPDTNDNCVAMSNPAQVDTDADLIGDPCDTDDDGDTLLDSDDCAPLDPQQGVPEEVALLSVTGVTSGQALLDWTPAARADSYDVSRGALSGLSAGYGACLASLVPGQDYLDTDVPPVGEGFAYLVSGRDAGCGGVGPSGNNSAGQPRSFPCP